MALHSLGSGKSVMKNYIEIPELRNLPEKSYSEDDCIKITNSYFKEIKDRLKEILADSEYTNDEISDILIYLGYSINHVKSEKSISDMFKD